MPAMPLPITVTAGRADSCCIWRIGQRIIAGRQIEIMQINYGSGLRAAVLSVQLPWLLGDTGKLGSVRNLLGGRRGS